MRPLPVTGVMGDFTFANVNLFANAYLILFVRQSLRPFVAADFTRIPIDIHIHPLCLLELREFFHQLLQPKTRELYRNLRVFPITLAFVHSPFAVLRMDDPLPRLESLFAGRLWNRDLRPTKFFAARGEK